jgi:uncharacterized protein (DUF1697 family)
MTVCIALLRGINVGGRNKMPMRELRVLAQEIGLIDPRTVLQSGNLIVEAGKRPPATVERLLQEAVTERFGIAIDIVVRSSSEWHASIETNPFADMARTDPAHLMLLCAKTPVLPDGLAALRAAVKGRELAEASGCNLYMTFPDGIGTSKTTPSVIERSLGCSVTGRNWNTVLKIAGAL